MALATCLVALLLRVLGVLVSFRPELPGSDASTDQVLNVRIEHDKAEPHFEPETSIQTNPQLALKGNPQTEIVAVGRQSPRISTHQPPSERRPLVDWNKAIAESVTALESEKREHEEVRKSMWRQTRSVMFQPTDEFVPNDQEPLLADLRFKPELHVVGLGFKIGSCFIGLPLIGVPVEERSAAIRIFVCADGSG